MSTKLKPRLQALENMVNFLKNRNAMVAKVVNGTLVVHMPEAEPPTLWSVSMGQASSLGFKLRDDGSHWLFGTEDSHGTFTTIARFKDRQHASDTIGATARALLKAGCQGTSLKRVAGKLALYSAALVVAVGVVLLAIVYSNSGPVQPANASMGAPAMDDETLALYNQLLQQQGGAAPQPGAPPAAPSTNSQTNQPTIGVPLSADDILMPSRQ